jgi:DNA-binding GntR family transcriptional regulator
VLGYLAMMPAATTRASEVFEQLRADILSGQWLPGSRLRFAQLSTCYDASMGVTREALSRLAAQGLVTSEAQHGFRVQTLSAHDLVDLTETRCHVETLALAQAITHGTVEWEAQLVGALHGLEHTPMYLSGEERQLDPAWSAARLHFHDAVFAGCPNRRLRATVASLRDSAELYRHWSAMQYEEDVQPTHRDISEAALARDAAAACRALTEHLVETARRLFIAAPDADATCLARLLAISTIG